MVTQGKGPQVEFAPRNEGKACVLGMPTLPNELMGAPTPESLALALVSVHSWFWSRLGVTPSQTFLQC